MDIYEGIEGLETKERNSRRMSFESTFDEILKVERSCEKIQMFDYWKIHYLGCTALN